MNWSAIWSTVKPILPVLMQIAGWLMARASHASAAKVGAAEYTVAEQFLYVQGQWYVGVFLAVSGGVWALYEGHKLLTAWHVGKILKPIVTPSAADPAAPEPGDSLTALAAAHERMILDLRSDDSAIEEWYSIVKTTRAARKKALK